LLALGLLALALLAGEGALGMAGFLLAYELVGTRDSVRARLQHGLPVVGIVLAWLVVYVLGGYGTHGSGEYINPIDQPLDYALAFPIRIGNALSVLLAGAPADIWFLAPAARASMAILGTLSAVVMAPWLWSVTKSQSPEGASSRLVDARDAPGRAAATGWGPWSQKLCHSVHWGRGNR
jgi:hypothetical protein